MKIKRMVGLRRIVRVPALRFIPPYDFADILNEALTSRNILHCEHTLAVHPGTSGLYAPTAISGGGRLLWWQRTF